MFPDPIPAKWKSDGRPVLLFGAVDADHVLYAVADGGLDVGRFEWFITDYRYDPESKMCYDAKAPAESVDDDSE